MPYVYIFLRKDIPQTAQIIQAAHATHEMALRIKEEQKPEKIAHFVLFQANDEAHLERIKTFLDTNSVGHYTFYEPDYDMGHTAIACEPIYGDRRNIFRKFKMWK